MISAMDAHNGYRRRATPHSPA